MIQHPMRVSSNTSADETVWSDVPTGPSRRRRILYVSEDMGVGGLERVIATLCRNVDPELFDPGVVCLREGGEFADELLPEGFPVFQLPYDGRADYLAFRHLAGLVRHYGVDIIHSHNTGPFIAAGLATLVTPGVRLIHTDHARAFPDKLRYAVAENLLSRVASRVVGVSTHTTENLVRYERLPRRKLATIPNGIDPPAPSPGRDLERLRQEFSIPVGHRVLGLGCRHTEQKNLAMMLDAFALLRADNKDVTLVICGDGPLRESLESRARELDIAADVRFPGLRTDMLDLLDLFDVYVMTSHWEGLPMAVLEAMAFGLPIVATRVGGLADAVRDGESGFLVEPGNTAAFAAALDRLLAAPALREQMSAVARRLFLESFSAQAMTRRYEALYHAE